MSYYAEHAAELFDSYHRFDSQLMHADWIPYMPAPSGWACDVGAGTGRDANWLAAQGWQVVAVEPEVEFRERGMAVSHPGVRWLADSLPGLTTLRAGHQRFDLILLSAVWMHVPPVGREEAFKHLASLLAPAGVLVITLRHSSDAEEIRERGFYTVSLDELLGFAPHCGLELRQAVSMPDDQGRAHVSWQTAVFVAETSD